ncbi:hypothetical protein C0585_08260, partial [Candidatus Woesearchaeota archaeon]
MKFNLFKFLSKKNAFHKVSNKLILFLIILVLIPVFSSSFNQDIKLLLEKSTYNQTATPELKEWEVQFNTTNQDSELTIQILTPNKITYKNFYARQNGEWSNYFFITQTPSLANDYALKANWLGTSIDEGGRILFDIIEPGYYAINMTFLNTSQIINNKQYYEQKEPYTLSISSPIFTFSLCFFNETYSLCNPLTESDPGFYGENIYIDSNGNAQRTLILPKDSTITKFDMNINPSFDNPLSTYDYLESIYNNFDLCEDSDEITLAISTGTYLKKVNITSNQLIYPKKNIGLLIKSIECAELDLNSPNEEIVISGDTFIKIYSYNLTLLNSYEGIEDFQRVISSKLKNDYTTEIKRDADNPTSIFRLKNSTYYLLTNYSMESISTSNMTCYIRSAINYNEEKKNISFKLNQTTYDLNTNLILYDSQDFYMENQNDIVGYECLGCNQEYALVNTQGILPSHIKGIDCQIEIPLVYQGDNSNMSLEVQIKNGTQTIETFIINGSNITNEIIFNYYPSKIQIAKNLTRINDSLTNLYSKNTGFTTSAEQNTCELVSAFNYQGQKKNITFTINSKETEIPIEKITAKASESYKISQDTGANIFCVGCTQDYTTINITEILQGKKVNGTSCSVSLALNYKNSTSNSLQFTVGSQTININESQIKEKANNLLYPYSSTNLTYDSTYSQLLTDSDLMILTLQDMINRTFSGANCYVGAKICYNGASPQSNIILSSANGDPEDLSNFNLTNMSSCQAGTINIVKAEIDCSLITDDNNLQINLDGAGNYSFPLNEESNLNNSFYFSNPTCSSGCQLTGDYDVILFEEDSYEYTNLKINDINCTELNTNEFINLTCQDCDSNENYRLILDQNQKPITEIYTNTSLNHTKITIPLDCTDLESNNEFYITCDSCDNDNYYNLMLEEDQTPFIYIQVANKTAYQNITLSTSCSELNDNPSLKITCDSCDEENTMFIPYSYLDKEYTSYVLNSQEYNYNNKDFKVEIKTNTSLRYQWIDTEVNCNDINEYNTINYTCVDCNSTSYYNLLVDHATTGNSTWYDGSIQDINGNLMSRIYLLYNTDEDDLLLYDTDNKIHSFTSDFSNLTGFPITFSQQIYDVSTKEYTTIYDGYEILIGLRYKTELYNSTGSLIYTYPYSGRSVLLTTLESINTILIGTRTGQLYSCIGSTCQLEKTFSSEILDIASSENNELLILESDKLSILDKYYNIKTEIPNEDETNEKTLIENIDQTPQEEILILDTESIKQYSSYVTDSLNISLNNSILYSLSTQLNESKDISLNIIPLQQIVDNCYLNFCIFPINFTSSYTDYYINIKELNLEFTYPINISLENNIQSLAVTDNLNSDDMIEYQALKIIYNTIPIIPIYVYNIVNASSFLLGSEEYYFNKETCTASSGAAYLGYTREDGTTSGCAQDYFINTYYLKQPDYIWYNDQTIKIVEINSTSYQEPQEYITNITVSLKDQFINETITNVTFNLTLDSNHKKNIELSVDWYKNGTYYELNLSEISDCDAANPSLNKTTLGNHEFYACIKDTDSDNVTEYLKLVQPLLTHSSKQYGGIRYKITSSPNAPPILLNTTYSPEYAQWGTQRNFTINIIEPDNDNLSARIWIYDELILEWINLIDFITTQDEFLTINVTLPKQLAGANKYKFEYCDTNGSTCLHITNTTIQSMSNIQKNNVTINQYDTSGTNLILVQLNNSRTNQVITDSVICQFTINENIEHITLINSTGHCYYEIPPTYEGLVNITIESQSNYFYNQKIINTNRTLLTLLHPEITVEEKYPKIESTIEIKAEIKNEEGTITNLGTSSWIFCDVLITDLNQTIIFDELVEIINGVCTKDIDIGLDTPTGNYNVTIQLVEIPNNPSIVITSNTDSEIFQIFNPATINSISSVVSEAFLTNVSVVSSPLLDVAVFNVSLDFL